MNRRTSLMLIICCALPVLLVLAVLFTGQKDVSDAENRTLRRYPAFSLKSFLDGTFQADLEQALSDQYPYGPEIKSAVLDAQNTLTRAEGALLGTGGDVYMEITAGYAHFAGDEHRIVEMPWAVGRDEARIAAAAEAFNHVAGVKKYVYFIRNSRAQDFTLTEAENTAVYDRVRAAYHADGYGCFAAADYEDFCRWFYQTDHHWNHRGADRGYREIMALLGRENEIRQPEREWTFDVVFNGSYARQTRELCADERFGAYTYDLPRARVTLNGKKGTYGHAALYEKDRFPTDELRNHYAYYYGGDYGEIAVEGGGADGRLLIVADSYSNPLNLLLASHFESTYIIDLRYYEKDMGKPFDWDAYIAEHRIDTVLMLGDIALYAGAQEEGV